MKNVRVITDSKERERIVQERNNRTIQNSMLKILEEKQDQWPEALPGVVFADRTSKQKSTGYTPFYLMYGREARLPVDTDTEADTKIPEVDRPTLDEAAPNEIKERLAVIEKLRSETTSRAIEHITTAQDRQKRDYQKRRRPKQAFEVGDAVLLWNRRRADRKGGKAKEPWGGPS